jgi:predicted adenine nucleotide alpha hydrolase (AANH) superfamily ATPase
MANLEYKEIELKDEKTSKEDECIALNSKFGWTLAKKEIYKTPSFKLVKSDHMDIDELNNVTNNYFEPCEIDNFILHFSRDKDMENYARLAKEENIYLYCTTFNADYQKLLNEENRLQKLIESDDKNKDRRKYKELANDMFDYQEILEDAKSLVENDKLEDAITLLSKAEKILSVWIQREHK